MFALTNLRFLIVMLLMWGFTQVLRAEEIKIVIAPEVESSSLTSDERFMLAAFQAVLKLEVENEKNDYTLFLKRIAEKKWNAKSELEIYKPFFERVVINRINQDEVIPGSNLPETAMIQYIPQKGKIKDFIYQIIHDLPDLTLPTLYLNVEIVIEPNMTWSDLGVSKRENFVSVLKDSWKKWASEQFKNFQNVVILEKDLPEGMNLISPASYVLKWTSKIKKTFSNESIKTAGFEVVAQYALINAKTNEIVLAYDFPIDQKKFSTNNPKTLSSQLASLVYNLLNSQVKKITNAFANSKNAGLLNSHEFKVTGSHGIADVYLITSKLNEAHRSLGIMVELKTFATAESIITIKSLENRTQLNEIFSKEGGKLPLNEQKILIFHPADSTFAIILKDVNN